MRLTRRDFVLLITIIYFTFIGGTFYSQLNFSLRLANQLIVTGILGFWLWGKLKKKEGLPSTSLDAPLALYLVANLVSSFLGQSPRFSLEGLWFSITHILAFYILVDLIRQGWLQRLTWSFYMASAVVCLVGLTEFLAWYVGTPLFSQFAQGWLEIGGWQDPIPPKIYRLAITLNGPTPLSAYLALLMPPAIGLIMTLSPRNENRKALMIWLALALPVQILTFSRAGILALGVSLPLTLLGWWWVTGQPWPNLRRSWSRLNLAYRATVLGCGLVSLGGGVLWLQRSFSHRTGSTDFRFTLWDTALNIFQDNWLAGVGPGNFGRALLYLNDAALPRRQISTAHNIYLNTAAELGLLGLVAGVCLFLALIWAWRQHWLQLSKPAERLRLIACGAALAGLAAQTLVDTYLATPNMLLMLALVAYIAGTAPKSSRPLQGAYTAYVALAALLIYLALFVRIGWADAAFQRSFVSEEQGDLREAISQAEQAYRLDPDLTLRLLRLASLEARLAYQSDDPSLTQAAVEHYQLALQQEPIFGLNSANLAGLLWQQDQSTEAIATLQRAIIAEQNPLYWVNLGYFYEQAGNWAKAGEAYGYTLYLAPSLAASGFWQASPARTERWSIFIDSAVSYLPQDDPLAEQLWRANLAVEQGDLERVAAIIEPLLPVTDQRFYPALIELYLSQGQAAQTMPFLDALPESGQKYRWLGRIKLQSGEYGPSEKLLRTAIFLGDQAAYYYLGQLFELKGDLQAAEKAYQRGFWPYAIPEDIPVTIYGRLGAGDFGPQLLRIGVGPRQAQSWLALAKLYEDQQRFNEAKQVYHLLLREEPFLEIAQERLEQLEP